MPRQHLKKRPDGRYRCKYQDRYFYGQTEREAFANRDEYIRNQADGIQQKDMTVRIYSSAWLPVHKTHVSNRVYNDYARLLDCMNDVIGDMLLKEVKPSHIKTVYNTFVGRSESLIHRARMIYNAVFETAVDDGYCRTNPCKADTAKPHKGTQGSHRNVTDEERNLILSTEHRCQLGALVMMYAGLRRGEVMALDIDRDCDFKAKTITVSYAVAYEGNQPIISDPKTEAGKRTIPMVDILFNTLKGKHGLVFPSAKGAIMTETAFRRSWESYLLCLSKAAGHDVKVRCHDLRHTYCTMLRDAGVEMHLAMTWMGHADEKMILRIYDHVTEQRVKKAVKNVENLLSGGQNGGQNQSDVENSPILLGFSAHGM